MYYSGIPTFLRCQYHIPENADIGIVGVPYSGGNWVERTQNLAPRAVRDFSMGFHRSHRAFKINPFDLCRIRDLGDVDIPNVLDPNKAVIDTNVLPKNRTITNHTSLYRRRSFHNSANSPFTRWRKLSS